MDKLKNYSLSLILGYILLFLLFLVTSIIFAYTNIQDSALNIAIYICLFLACMFSSFILGKREKRKGFIYGIIFGMIFYGLVFIISSIISWFSFSLSILIYFGIITFIPIKSKKRKVWISYMRTYNI